MTDDDLVHCVNRQWLRPHFETHKCQQAKRAGLSQWASIEIGRDLATLPQRCPAFKAKETK